MDAPAPSPIACVLGRYALGEEIARGGLATVHLGLVLGEAGFSRTVAIKRLLPGFARDPELVASFLDEAKLAARIRDPHVVPTLDVLAQDGELFVVMEYVHGESLSALLRAAGGAPLPLAVVSAILVDALHGLHAAHEARDERGAPLHLVHRDVSPQNLLVGADGVTRVLDFGIAKAVGRSQITREGQVKGKLAYMAPEQLGQSAERASDLYATGVCLWEALTMRRLFAADNESAVLAKILAGAVHRPSKYAPDLPPALDALTLKALRRDPRERFATAREMALALEGVVAPASAAEVSEWVERLAAPVLTRRGERVAAIEASGPRATAVRPLPPPAVALPAPEPLLTPAAASSTPSALPSTRLDLAAPRPSRRRATWIVWSGLGVLVATAALLASALRGARADAERPPAIASTPLLNAAPARTEPTEPVEPTVPSPSAAPSTAPAPPPAASSPPPTPAAAHPRPAAAGPRTNCDPPYSVSADGVRHYKKQCLR